MIVVTCDDGAQYGFDFEGVADAMRITKSGKVRFSPHEDVQATLEFPTPAVRVDQGDESR